MADKKKNRTNNDDTEEIVIEKPVVAYKYSAKGPEQVYTKQSYCKVSVFYNLESIS